MRIGTGAQLEIFTDDEGSVIFKKYSPMAELSAVAQGYAAALGRAIKATVAICDRERIVAASGSARRELIGAYIGDGAEAALQSRKAEQLDAARPIGDSGLSVALLCPIVAQSEVVGGVLRLREKADAGMDSAELPLLKLTACLLALNFEE